MVFQEDLISIIQPLTGSRTYLSTGSQAFFLNNILKFRISYSVLFINRNKNFIFNYELIYNMLTFPFYENNLSETFVTS